MLSHKVIVQLIAATTTTSGLTIACDIDATSYPKGAKVPDQQISRLNIRYDRFHPDWNYTIVPKLKRSAP